jgi:DNA-directed RNA polymerase sigma subunit (sigma70/sigma32)
MEKIHDIETRIYVDQILASLKPRQLHQKTLSRNIEIWKARVLDGLTLRQVGEEFGLQCERVRQIEASISRRLREKMKTRRWAM